MEKTKVKKEAPSPAGAYKKPVFEKEDGLEFPRQIVEKFNGGRFCVQCSGCHGCR